MSSLSLSVWQDKLRFLSSLQEIQEDISTVYSAKKLEVADYL